MVSYEHNYLKILSQSSAVIEEFESFLNCRPQPEVYDHVGAFFVINNPFIIPSWKALIIALKTCLF